MLMLVYVAFIGISSAAPKAKKDMKWVDVVNRSRTSQDICRAVKERVVYKAEHGDEWQAPEDTWAMKSGDCEDFALCVQEMCREIGQASSVYIISARDDSHQAHAVTVGSIGSKLWVSSNGDYREVWSFDEIKGVMALYWYCSVDNIELKTAPNREERAALGDRAAKVGNVTTSSKWVDSVKYIDETPKWADVPQYVEDVR
ncbi:hypothetical protein BVX97_03720 [bacterium E08(2017)]|nr:hypothetical protein BVX97_03720 [bacterium E08(2017)]